MQTIIKEKEVREWTLWHYVCACALVSAFGFVLTLIFAISAHAEVTNETVATPAVPAIVTLQPWIIAILVGTITPLITGFVTKLSASSGVKAIVSLVLVAIGTVINMIVTNNGVFTVRDAVVLFATTLVAHMASYFQVWEPIGTPRTTFTNEWTADIGIGSGGSGAGAG